MNENQKFLKMLYDVASLAALPKADHIELEKIYLKLNDNFADAPAVGD